MHGSPESRSRWIYQVLRTNLGKISPRLTACFAVGKTMEELTHVRKLVGDKGTIKAYDIVFPDRHGEESLRRVQAEFHRIDIREMEWVLSTIGAMPNLIVCRHPQVIQTVSRNTGEVVEINDWWIGCLSTWGRMVVENGGMMLVSTFDERERAALVLGMINVGLDPALSINNLAPRDISLMRGKWLCAPDRYVLTVGVK